MLQSIGGVFPSNIITIRLCHHVGIVTTTTIGDKRLVHFVDLVIVLLGSEFVGHLLKNGIALCIHAERVVIDGFCIKKVILHALLS